MKLALVLNRQGQQQIQKVSLVHGSPVSIGRGWQNDIIVDDEFVDSEHARLSLADNNEMTLEDLGSENGTLVGTRKISASVIDSGTSISVGDTVIVVHDTEAAVAPVVRRNSVRVFANRFNSVSGVVAATLVAGVSVLGSLYAMEGEAATGGRVLSAFLGAGSLILLWSLFAALVGKVFRNETNAPLHWVFVSIVMATMMFTTFIVDIVKFNVDSALANSVIDNVLTCGLIALVSYVTFTLSTRLSTGRKIAGVSLLALLPVAYNLLQPTLVEEHESWSSWANVNKLSHPPAYLFRKPTTLDAHLLAADDLFAALDDELATESSDSTQSPANGKIQDGSFKMSIAE